MLRPTIRRSDGGLTVIELSIVMALLSIVIVTASSFLISGQRQEATVSEATNQQANVRLALERVSRLIRQATYPQGYNAYNSSLLAAADKFDITFYADADGDGDIERVRYWLDAATHELKRSTVAPDCTTTPCTYPSTPAPAVVASSVRNNQGGQCGRAATATEPLFRFWKGDPRSDGVEVSTPTAIQDQLVDINFVQITVQLDVTPGNSPACQDVTTSVNIRNWRGL